MLEFEPGLMIWTTISFGILVLLLYKAALPPLLVFLARREKTIAEQLSRAQANQKQSEELLEQYKLKLAEIHRSADGVLERAKSEGEKLREEILARAQKQSELVVERARQDLAREKDKIVEGVRRETAELVAAAAGRVLRRVVTLEDNRRLIEESLRQGAA